MAKKKTLSIITALTLSASLLAACGGGEEASTPEEPKDTAAQTTTPEVEVPSVVYQGLGIAKNFREGPGADSEDVPVYSFNYVTADALFDEEGRILNLYVDMLEVSTPNYDGASMPHFTGWPGQSGYNNTNHDTAEVDGQVTPSVEVTKAEIDGWQTKRERGDAYGMNFANDWYKQMDHLQKFFKGKTVAEIEEWNAKYTSDVNGRPLKAESDKPEDIEKYSKLTDAEKAELADVTSGATFSLTDAHGNVIEAIKNAYENRVKVSLTGEEEEEATADASGPVKAENLQDGDYSVEYKDFDAHGYKPTLNVTVSGGKITEVTYDEIKEDGSKKSEDPNYGDGHMTITPKDAYAQLMESTVVNQGTADAVSGATASTTSFNALVSYFIQEMGPNGTTSGTIE